MKSLARKVINWDAYYEVEKFIENIEDESTRIKYEKLLEEIWEKTTEIDCYIVNKEYENHIKELSERGVELIAGNKRSISSMWSKMFASSVSKEKKKEIFYNSFRWHIFSFNEVDALKGNEAREAFDAANKENIYIFYQFSDEAYLIKNGSLLKAEDFDIDSSLEKADLYIFSPTEKWTYVHTHEEVCGPYFYKV